MILWTHAESGQTCEGLPSRIRLSDGTTLTNNDVTEELAAAHGWSCTSEYRELVPERRIDPVIDGTL